MRNTEAILQRRCPTCAQARWWQSRVGPLVCAVYYPSPVDAMAALVADLAPHTVLLDRVGSKVEAFLAAQPAWRHRGVTRFSPEDSDWPALYVFSRPAAAFAQWHRTT
jgi:hypothetical protein